MEGQKDQDVNINLLTENINSIIKDDLQSVLRSLSTLIFLSCSIEFKSMLFVANHITYLRPFKFFFQLLH